jgi:predicted nucleic acid-binding protein
VPLLWDIDENLTEIIAPEFYQQLRDENEMIYTSDYVLDETITLVFKRLPFKTAKESLAKLDKAIEQGYLQVEWVTPERFEKAKILRLKYQDKPKISFTDLSSMVVMEELGLKDIITGDEHFEHVGMGFQRKP